MVVSDVLQSWMEELLHRIGVLWVELPEQYLGANKIVGGQFALAWAVTTRITAVYQPAKGADKDHNARAPCLAIASTRNR